MFAVFVTAGTAAVTGCSQKKLITSFDTISVYFYGTSAEASDYEIVHTDEGVTISYYYGIWEYNDARNMEDYLARQYNGTKEDYQTILEVLNDCNFASWDGFHKTNSYALDGGGFALTAVINDGQKVQAHGSNAVPKHFSDFEKCISEMLANGITVRNILDNTTD